MEEIVYEYEIFGCFTPDDVRRIKTNDIDCCGRYRDRIPDRKPLRILTTVKAIAEVYIWIIRATPLMVQALYGYFVIPKLFGVDISSTIVGIGVIALNSGAFISEIVKGALMGIDPGQKEAGASLGLTSTQTMLHLVIPPAFKSALPALFNQFITSVKDTAVNEITHQAQAYAALSFKAIPTYTALAVFYLIILSILIIVQKQIERKMR